MSEINATIDQLEDNAKQRAKKEKIIKTKDKLNAARYSEKATLSDNQERVRTTMEKYKYIRTRIFDCGVIKQAVVGLEKIINGKPRIVFNHGIDGKKFQIPPRVNLPRQEV